MTNRLAPVAEKLVRNEEEEQNIITALEIVRRVKRNGKLFV